MSRQRLVGISQSGIDSPWIGFKGCQIWRPLNPLLSSSFAREADPGVRIEGGETALYPGCMWPPRRLGPRNQINPQSCLSCGLPSAWRQKLHIDNMLLLARLEGKPKSGAIFVYLSISATLSVVQHRGARRSALLKEMRLVMRWVGCVVVHGLENIDDRPAASCSS